MRILTGPIHPDLGRILCEDSPDTQFFSDADVPFHVLLNRLPAGWVPDVVVIREPEYRLLPAGIEASPFPVVFLLGDWNFAFSQVAGILSLADYVLTDTAGVTALRRSGSDRVAHWPLFTFDPAVHRPRPEESEQYDVVFVGNLNHELHAERSRWLARLAQLHSRHRILITMAYDREAYARLHSQSRLIFNHAVRGEMNMRAYEALATGRVLLMEAANLEVRDHLGDGESVVLYDEESLEARIDGLLADPAACGRIGQAGLDVAQGCTGQRRWQALKVLLAGLALPRPDERRWWTLPPADRFRALARHDIAVSEPAGRSWADRWLQLGLAEAPGDPFLRHGHAVLAAVRSGVATDRPVDPQLVMAACQAFEGLLRDVPRYGLAWVNFGRFLEWAGWPGRAAEAYRQALTVLDRAEPFDLGDFLFPPTSFGRFKVAWERAVIAGNVEGGRRQLRATAAAWLANLLWTASPDQAEALSRQALDDDPDHPGAWRILGECAQLRGDGPAAVAAWRRSLALLPYQFDLRWALATQLRRMGLDIGALLQETHNLIAVTPLYAPWQAVFDALAHDGGTVGLPTMPVIPGLSRRAGLDEPFLRF